MVSLDHYEFKTEEEFLSLIQNKWEEGSRLERIRINTSQASIVNKFKSVKPHKIDLLSSRPYLYITPYGEHDIIISRKRK